MAQKGWRLVNRASRTASLAAACVAAAIGTTPATHADEVADTGAGGGEATQVIVGNSVADAQVVASMQKGIDYLLSIKQADNWELHPWKQTPDGERGGETGLVLYALLHAGDSLQDDPVYRAKLHWRGKELGPVVQWLEKNMVKDTYVAGLEASELTLLPKLKDEKPSEGPAAALDSAKYYVMMAMGPDGGFTYTSPGMIKVEELWQAYADAAVRGNRNGPEKKNLDQALKILRDSWGGAEIALQMLASELKHAQQAAKGQAELNKVEAQMKELDKYAREAPPSDDPRQHLAQLKTNLAQLLAHNGNPAGMTKLDPATKKKVPLTKEELAAQVESAKKEIAVVESGFVPKGDLSNGQYGTLGSWALADYGIELPDRYWEVLDHFWRKVQHPDGSWSYGPARLDLPGAGSMSVAGIASLFVCQEFMDNELRLVPKPDKNIDAGLAWLANQYTGAGNYYYMYGVERVGLSSGLKFFGPAKDWYKMGATQIVKHQHPDGQWTGGYASTVDSGYALLFLARGRNPVVFNKLQYDGPWNARPHDDAYVTRWMSKRYEKPINWQVVNLHVDPVEWQDAPILLITGSVDPKFTRDDIAKLREYLNSGGMIFSTADGGAKDGQAFTNAIKKYASEVVGAKYEMRQLPKNHPLFSKELDVDLPSPPPLWGMSNDVRELWIHSTTDVGADWQMRKFSSKNFDLGAALYFYASSRGSLRSKLQPLAVTPSAEKPARTMELARIDYSGNPDPEPGAWPRMAKLAQANFKTQLHLATVSFANLDAKKYPLAHLTGTTRVTFTADDAQALKAYLEAGGLLFVDAAGGNPDFAASCRDLIKRVYPDNPLESLPADHPIYTGALPDGAPVDVKFRSYGNTVLHRMVITGALQGVVAGGRTRVLFSSWDICSGFLGTNTWGILGYSPATSQALGRNILLYSQNPAAGPSNEKDAAAQK